MTGARAGACGGAGRRRHRREMLVTAPSFAWLALLFVVPTAIMLAMALRPADPYGGVGPGFTLETLRGLWKPSHLAIAWRTLWLSAATTAICLVLAVPAGYCIARARPRRRRLLLLLIIVPFWTSFLIRIFAWKVLLHPEGWLKQLLVMIGLADAGTSLLYNAGAVILVMVYTYLPFAILPVYAAAERFDFTLIEAARDLGARRLQAFARVFLPGIRRGLVTAVLMVLIPALGTFVIPDLVGGTTGEMLGNKIAQRVFADRNLPEASALAAALILAVLLPMLAVLALKQRERPAPAVEEDA
ncbi:MAG TPA: spermidine/putrescine ABC transporter permease [Planctomycetes bacterium]|nr:spermidine/putrescine ABC transporter permease [Planctomycetota bacterium]